MQKALCASLLLSTSSVLGAAADIVATSSPLRPFAEHNATGIALNGDISVRNDTDFDLELEELSLDVMSSSGALIQKLELNRNGISPSILTIPDRKLERHSAMLIYNPFHQFGVNIPVARLRYHLTFKRIDAAGVFTADLEVVPVEPPSSRFVFPLTGKYLVWDGHDFYSHHRRWNYLNRGLVKLGYTGNAGRYAYDFIALDDKGARSNGDEAVNENWVSFGKPIRATSAGMVAAVRGDALDDRTYRWGSSKDPNAAFGNYVVLKHPDGTYSVFGHVMHDSPNVKLGQQVRAGQIIARIGASGDALFPHLHYQRTLQPSDLGEGVPVAWSNVKRTIGSKMYALPNGYIDTGDIVTGR